MSTFIDMAGWRFGRLMVLAPAVKRGRELQWFCACDCGRMVTKQGMRLRLGKTSSCGCLKSDAMKARNTTHGDAARSNKSAAYRSWRSMMVRCYNEANHKFPDYGGRGVTVCAEWNEYANFLRDMGPRPAGSSLDRIDVNGPYCKANCRWADAKTQAQNKRNNVLITYHGRTMCVMEWARETGIDRRKIAARIGYGWPLDRVLAA